MNLLLNKAQLTDWLVGTTCLEYVDEEYDGSGNRWYSKILLKDGRHYSLDFLNDEPREKCGKKGYLRDTYELVEVVPEEKVITVTEWVPVLTSE